MIIPMYTCSLSLIVPSRIHFTDPADSFPLRTLALHTTPPFPPTPPQFRQSDYLVSQTHSFPNDSWDGRSPLTPLHTRKSMYAYRFARALNRQYTRMHVHPSPTNEEIRGLSTRFPIPVAWGGKGKSQMLASPATGSPCRRCTRNRCRSISR